MVYAYITCSQHACSCFIESQTVLGEPCADKVVQERLAACVQHLTEYGLDQDVAAAPSSRGIQQQIPPAIVAFLRLSYHEVALTYYLYERMPKDERTQIVNRDECLQSADGIISTLLSLKQTDESEMLRPWWLTMSSIYSAGMIFNADMASNLALGASHHRRQLSKCIELLEYLVSMNKFIMAREALWALKTIVSMTTVNVSDVLQGLHSVNMQQADSEAVNKGRTPAVLVEKDVSTREVGAASGQQEQNQHAFVARRPPPPPSEQRQQQLLQQQTLPGMRRRQSTRLLGCLLNSVLIGSINGRGTLRMP